MTESLSIPEMHQRHLIKALNSTPNIELAAKRLGVTWRTIYLWKRIYGIEWSETCQFWYAAAKAFPVMLIFFCSCCSPRQPNGIYWRDFSHRVRARRDSLGVHQCDSIFYHKKEFGE